MYPLWQVRERVSDGTGALSALQLHRKRSGTKAEAHRVTDCIECGSLFLEMSSALPLLDYIRLGKTEVMKIIRSRKGR